MFFLSAFLLVALCLKRKKCQNAILLWSGLTLVNKLNVCLLVLFFVGFSIFIDKKCQKTIVMMSCRLVYNLKVSSY